MKLAHGEHNSVLCEELLKKATHYDWVITTAFYSAIHFIDHKLFTLGHGNHGYTSIEDANRALRCPSRHVARKQLVNMYLPTRISQYNFLDKNCRNARYTDYNVSQIKAEAAKNMLDILKSTCCS